MKKKEILNKKYMLLGFNPYSRVDYFLKEIESKKKDIKREDRERLDWLWKRFKHAEYKLRTLKIIRLIAVILLYSSIVSAISSSFLVEGLQIFTSTMIKVSGIIGSTVFIVIVAVTSKFIEMYLGDIYVLSAKMIAIYTKYDK